MKKFFICLLALAAVIAVTFTSCKEDKNNDPADTTVAVTGVSLNQTTATLTPGGTLTLTPTVAPDNATNKAVSWQSSHPAIATVNNGTVTAVAAGNATITVTTADGDKTATCAVTVNAATVAVTGVTLNPTTATLTVGGTLTLTPTVAPDNATNKAVTWQSSSTAVATVNNGTVTAVAAGNATITVTTADGGKTATCDVTVNYWSGCNGIIVAPSDLPGTYNWNDALTACPAGWRLPTLAELLCLCNNRTAIGGFIDYIYWSSTEYSSTGAYGVYFRGIGDCETFGSIKTSDYCVRCVQDVP
jgi:uncharacterized protein YjdB